MTTSSKIHATLNQITTNTQVLQVCRTDSDLPDTTEGCVKAGSGTNADDLVSDTEKYSRANHDCHRGQQGNRVIEIRSTNETTSTKNLVFNFCTLDLIRSTRPTDLTTLSVVINKKTVLSKWAWCLAKQESKSLPTTCS